MACGRADRGIHDRLLLSVVARAGSGRRLNFDGAGTVNEFRFAFDVAQTLLLIVLAWVVTDIRDRVKRLEDGHLIWDGHNRRTSG